MRGDQLFVFLVLQLRSYSDAAVLWSLLRQGADQTALRGSIQHLADNGLASTVTPRTARRSLDRLAKLNLITLQVHRKTATIVTVHGPAVRALLERPLHHRLPGRDPTPFPFLQWDVAPPAMPSLSPPNGMPAGAGCDEPVPPFTLFSEPHQELS
jgi:hypothetical protein